MLLEQRGDVDGADAVTVREHEDRLVEVVGHPPHPGARPGRQAGLGQRDLPILRRPVAVPGRRVALRQLEGEVAGQLAVVEEVATDLVTLVTQAEHEATEAVLPVRLHDVPQDGLAADVDERLGQLVAGLSDAGSHPPAQDDDGDVGRMGRGRCRDVCH